MAHNISLFPVKKVWLFFILVKISYMIFALEVYSHLSPLGDTPRYLAGEPSVSAIYSSTAMMDTVAGTLSTILGPLLANIPFLLASFYGVYYSIREARLSPKYRLLAIIMLVFPSFNIWTSIASKESVSVFFMGIILGTFFRIYRRDKIEKGLFFTALYLCLLFKPQYMLGVTSMYLFLFLSDRFRLKGGGKLALIGVFLISSALLLFIFRNEINQLSFIMPLHFSKDAGSTRVNDIWVDDFDVFYNAPYGMFIALFGPTISEAMSKPTHAIVWLESFIIMGFFIFYFIKFILISLDSKKVNVFLAGIVITSLFWISFVHYPFGALNPGSAVRYRESFYAFSVVILFYCANHIKSRNKMIGNIA